MRTLTILLICLSVSVKGQWMHVDSKDDQLERFFTTKLAVPLYGDKGIENFKISDIKSDPHLVMDLKLHNPNPIGFKLKKIDLQFTLDNQPIGSLILNKPVKLRGNQDFTLPLTFGTSISQLAAVAKPGIADIFAGKHIPFQFEGDITVQKFIFFRRTFHFNFSDDVSMNKIKID